MVLLATILQCLISSKNLTFELLLLEDPNNESIMDLPIALRQGRITKKNITENHHDLFWDSGQIRHSVLTRFMIGQSQHRVLAKARLELFKTFCYPTMIHQTSHNFFWLVLIDPGLDRDIIEEMTTLLTTFPFHKAYLILTNNTKWASDGISEKNPSATGYGVDLRTVAHMFQQGDLDIRTGNTDALLDTLESHQVSDTPSLILGRPTIRVKNRPLVLVETLLDADDGLHSSAIEYMQQDVQNITQQQQRQNIQSSLKSTWWILCASEHLEWHNRDIFKVTPEDYVKHGLSDGVVGRRAIPPECISAGFTRVGMTTITINQQSLVFPKKAQYNHFQTVKIMPPCNETTVQHCYFRSLRDFPGAVRSRSITSDSMSQLDPDLNYNKKNVYTADSVLHLDNMDQLWEILSQQFFISRQQIQHVSHLLYEHRKAILQENDEGRCIPGFPCRGHSQKTIEKLKSMISQSAERRPGRGTIVHREDR
jgi:Putative rhamnosyl transferase